MGNRMRCCESCRYCAALVRPYERSDGSTIFGYCFSDGDQNYSFGMGKGYPIWLPLDSGGGACEKYKRPRRAMNNYLGGI